jgi:hypothetical protein
MADRYQDRPFPADHDQGESDPLAELARLIGQTDPFGTMGRANRKVQPPRSAPTPDPYQQEPSPEVEDSPPGGRPPWIQRANRQEIKKPVHDEPEPEQDYQPNSVHPLHRYAAQQQHAAPQQDYQQPQHDHEPQYEESESEVDPSRYDDALYGQIESGAQDYQRDPAYPDDPYAYQDGYEDGEDQGEKSRRGIITVAAVLTLAVIGTGAAFAYRSYVATPRSGDPPIIRADNGPTKIVPSPADSASKTPDRMPAGDGTEKIVPREEAPVDINGRAGGGPRVVFPPLNPNSNPPSAASVATSNIPVASAGPIPSNGTLPNNEPRKIRTFSVRGDQADAGAPAATATVPPPGGKSTTAPKTAAPAQVAPRSAPSSANASANSPLSLSPQGAEAAPATEPRSRVAATNPIQTAPAPANPAASGGAFLVQVSSQPSEAVAQSSFRALQSKFPSVLGSQTPVIKRADLGEKGVVYRAMVGPFGTRDEAVQFCESLKSAGGQCFVPKN